MLEEKPERKETALEVSRLVQLNPEALNASARAFREFLQKPRMIGQERIQYAAVHAVGRFEGTLRNPDRPIRSILALGPSGTGKTMIFDLMAEFLFGKKHAMTKLSGQEYQEEHAISKLIGSPPGYVGSNVDERGPFPMLSPWNIGKHHYFKMLRDAAEKTHIKTDGITMTPQEAKDALLQNQNQEEIYSYRLRTLADAVSALEVKNDSPTERRDVKSSNQELLIAEIAHDAKIRIAQYTEALARIYGKIDWISMYLSMETGQDLSFDPEVHKRAVILVDEVDNANPAFFKIFYEILDRARVTLQNGMTTDFSEAVISMTSNKGAKEMETIMRGRKPPGFRIERETSFDEKQLALYTAARDAMNDMFLAPLRGRIDEVVVTREFTVEQVKAIIQMEVNQFQELLIERKTGIALRVSEAVKDFLWQESADKPEEGARLVQKKLSHYLRDPIDTMIQTGQLHQGDILHVDMGLVENEKKPIFRADTRNRKEQK
ncbi:MAG: AAA family ATPase [Candidatus Liptonbacteria bacterium]|nr:AAA family ATPase [Candidatus Liptonbacteria bacterium]